VILNLSLSWSSTGCQRGTCFAEDRGDAYLYSDCRFYLH